MKQNSSDLKRCPFCGGGFEVESDHHGEWIEHKATVPNCPVDWFQIHDEETKQVWNRRTF